MKLIIRMWLCVWSFRAQGIGSSHEKFRSGWDSNWRMCLPGEAQGNEQFLSTDKGTRGCYVGLHNLILTTLLFSCRKNLKLQVVNWTAQGHKSKKHSWETKSGHFFFWTPCLLRTKTRVATHHSPCPPWAVRWLILCVSLAGPQCLLAGQTLFWTFLWWCFWLRFIFTSVDFEKSRSSL